MTQPPPDSIEALLAHLQDQVDQLAELANPDTITVYAWVPAACAREASQRRLLAWLR